ncbi:hypothetical protein GCM10020295_21080 [Streptomyces cinereospinus]
MERYRGRRREDTWDFRTDGSRCTAAEAPDGRLSRAPHEGSPGGEEYDTGPFRPRVPRQPYTQTHGYVR